MSRRPLERFELFHSYDLDEVRDEMSRVLCPHQLDVIDPGCQLDARMHSARLRRIVLNYVEYGAPVVVDPGETGTFSVVQAHVSGQGVVSSGRDQLLATRDRIMVSSASEALHMSLSADTRLILLRIDSTAVEAVLHGLLGEEISKPVRFELGMNVSYGVTRAWYTSLLDSVARVSRQDALLVRSPWIDGFEEGLISRLLTVQPSNYSGRLGEPAQAVSVRLVREAVDLIESGLGAPPAEIALARELGVGVRHLRAAFLRYRGLPLVDYLLLARLRRARRELLEARPGDVAVHVLAQRCGLDTPSFVSCYHAAFGELPDQTLRR